ncbi:MAG: hypothetical protein NZ455_06080 [Bacteroidia bacterium]|nr:hypothetical protein [Bacteroidia bacterium]MDW8345959.1 hypothetical protein [Bacteroidia bacterium]
MRSAAKHRSDSAARSTPTRAQRGTRPKKYKNLTFSYFPLSKKKINLGIDE